MKSLLDIQQDIRSLESTVKDMAARIEGINSDISELRNSAQDVQGRDFDYSRIEILAGQLPFGRHLLEKIEDGRACQMYIEMLLQMLRLDYDFETTVNRLVFIQWLQIQAEIDWSLEELFTDACGLEISAYDEFVRMMPKEYVENFILDAMIVANIGGEANREILEYIAEFGCVLGITTEQISILASVASAVLCRQFGKEEREKMERVLNCAKKYRCYIDSDMLDRVMQDYREIVVQYPKDSKSFSWKVKQGQEVRQGDLIAEYFQYSEDFFSTLIRTKKTIKSPSSGVIYQFSDHCIIYGVLSLASDDKDEIKEWVRQKVNN